MALQTGAMSFLELQNEVITFRFREAQRGSVKRWLNQRYAWVWAQATWPFKLEAPSALTLAAGSWTAPFATATDVLRPLNVYNDNGDPLRYLTPPEFQRLYEDTTGTGRPEDYTVINGAIFLGPLTDSDYTFTASYERMVSKLNSVGVMQPGLLSADDDYPVYDAGFHYMLVMGAIATGLKMVNDPTWEAIEDEYRAMVLVMQQELLPADRGETIQFGSRGMIEA